MTLPERSALFIDGSNFHATTKLLNLDVDYLRLLDFFKQKERVIRAYYYTALPDPSEQSHPSDQAGDTRCAGELPERITAAAATLAALP